MGQKKGNFLPEKNQKEETQVNAKKKSAASHTKKEKL